MRVTSKPIRLGFDLGYIASTLNNHTDIARELTRLFKTRSYLARKLTADDLEDKQQRLEQAILSALDDVQVLNEDRILRRYLDLIKATLRTNFYQDRRQRPEQEVVLQTSSSTRVPSRRAAQAGAEV